MSEREQDVEVGLYRDADRAAIEVMYRRVFGHDAAEASRLRWTWQYARNPATPPEGPRIWIARQGDTVVGQYATMPVTLSLGGREVAGSWGMDVMVAPERQRQGLGEVLFRTWDRDAGASLGLGLSDASHRLFQKLDWPDVGPVPCLVKPLTRRALRRRGWPTLVNRLVSASTLPFVRLVSRPRPMTDPVVRIARFDEPFTDLWQRLAPKFDLAVRRDASYLNWKYLSAPHVRYTVAALDGESNPRGWVVYRHIRESRGRVTLLVDFLADPDDGAALETLLGHVDREARAADSDKIRCHASNEAFRRVLRRSGYFGVRSTMEFVAKINAIPVVPGFYRDTRRWHVTLGDSDQDR